jgi:hypothetical protein
MQIDVHRMSLDVPEGIYLGVETIEEGQEGYATAGVAVKFASWQDPTLDLFLPDEVARRLLHQLLEARLSDPEGKLVSLYDRMGRQLEEMRQIRHQRLDPGPLYDEEMIR